VKLSNEARQALAAEYVIGTLRGRARARFEEALRADAELAKIVRRWEDELTPLAERVQPIDPPSRVWRAIEARVAPRATPRTSAFWRPFGLVAGGLATVLVAFFLWTSAAPRGADPDFVAVLTAPDSVPRVVVSMHQPDLLRVRVVKPWGTMDNQRQSLELWAMLPDGKPRSLGLVVNAMGDTMMHIDPADPRVQGARMLAVSMEPMGGSPTGQPTGTVVCSGAIATVKRA
jgi:anti-sigma-K factor RskA